ncbi:hypothetical protein AXG93_1248s1000 [Marchantia polymorpha subsp. ruderalis]|uniref:Uncharacterized protein n=1 Tax=Marchantia polymorpha subsp. ruderalis TaxID=1480154 RepID=A0A176VQS2_MARPO|nr:hypothetical protein AXG93_1248s1000 [Marchantia polymorpha subsp. ruderalis]
MKAWRLILEEDSSTESRRAALRERHVQEVGPTKRAAKEKEKSVGKKLRVIEERSTPVEPPRASKKDKGKAILFEEDPLRWNEVPVESIQMKVPREQVAEVLTMYSDTEEDPVALEEVAAKAVEDVAVAESGPQKVISPWTSTDTIILETGEEPSAEETQSPIMGAANLLSADTSVVPVPRPEAGEAEVTAKERRSQPTEAKYQALQKRLTEEVGKQRKVEQVGEGLREDVKRAKCKEQEYQIELAVRAKKLIEYEAARIFDLELIEKLEAQCGELRTQRPQAEKQLCEVEAKLTEAKGKNRQLSEETRDALTARVERCLRGYVLWQIKFHNGLRLREIEHRVAELIARSGRSHRRLSKKLESYLTRSRDAVANLEVELASVLRRLGLERRLEGAATADSAGVRTIRCSHQSR